MANKPTIPKGTRDFGPVQMMRRNYIFQTVRSVFESFGYQPIETPALESLETLLGKYGEEGDRLIFRILNSGNWLSKVGTQEISLSSSTEEEISELSKILSGQICEKALRYDLTVPFARFVVQHRNEVTFPFKRYQIQPVWRADRPQKGRYREFYQCDVDVIGSDSLLNEAELFRIIHLVFQRLGIRVAIKLNNRKILAGIAEVVGASDQLTDITTAIDKLDKIGQEKVVQELLERGISRDAVTRLIPVITTGGGTAGKIVLLEDLFKESITGKLGIDEVKKILDLITPFSIDVPVELDLSLARGLNYYTGSIIEVEALDSGIGSVCGGGRYDDLTGIFGLPGVSGVGVSFGADRIYDVLDHFNGFPDTAQTVSQVLFLNFGEKETLDTIPLLEKLRAAGIRTELYPDVVKMKKQMQYADQNHIPVVCLYGADEQASGQITVKEMVSGQQKMVAVKDLITAVQSVLNSSN